jgi:hypothetical protein
MTLRKRLFWGLLVAAPLTAPLAATAEGLVAASRSNATSGASASGATNWKRSELAASADIRFKRPQGIIKPEALIVTDQGADDQLSASEARPAMSRKTEPAAAAAKRLAPIAPPAISLPDAIVPSAAATEPKPAAKEPAKPESPASAPATEEAAANEPAGAAKTTTASSEPTSSGQIQDDQIQLAARQLMDQGLRLAAEEETLPSSPIPSDANRDPVDGTASPYDAGCYDNCCPPAPRLFWVGGVEATFLWPDLNSDGVSFAAEEIEDERYDLCSSQDVDIDSMYLSPRIWLGVQGCAWGANVRYWHLNASEGTYDPSIGGDGSWNAYDCGRPDFGYFSCNRLEAYTIDLEITRRFCIHNCWMQAAMGVRHASIENNEGVTGLALTEEGLLSGFARANRLSRGTGLLFGLYGRKPLYPCSCVNWFYNARISTLWGPTQTSAETFAQVQSNDPDFVAGAASVNGAYSNIDDTLFIGEIQLGLEWNYALACLPANAFFRTALEYQRWDGGKGFSAADSFAGIALDDGFPVESVVSTSASAAEPQMDLFGFTIGTGLTW